MQYLGSKKTLLPFIQKTIFQTVQSDLKNLTFCDLFAGTGIVGNAFKPLVKKVTSNDIEFYSYVLNRNLIGNHRPNLARFYLKILYDLEGIEGFIFEQYSCGGKAGRMYFSSENGKRIDAIRLKIRDWKFKNIISDDEYFYLLASLLESADKVANTTSVYSAYLKKLKSTAQKPLILKTQSSLDLWKEKKIPNHQVYNEDACALIKNISGDILYLDPPYNGRQYGANYHLLNTIALYKPFKPKGKTGQRDYYKSKFCKKAEVARVFRELIKNAQFKYIFLSYNNEGLMSPLEIRDILCEFGKYSVVSTPYKRYKSSNLKASKETQEFIHILEKE